MERKKAIFINGGAGRVLCSIPALEKLSETDDDFVIISEAHDFFFKGNPKLHSKVYQPNHKNLFKDILKERECISPEPYRVFEYYNQQCNLIEAFNKEINGEISSGIPNIFLTPAELEKGKESVEKIKDLSKKKKVCVLQPVGSGAQKTKKGYFDESGRSINIDDLNQLVSALSRDYAVLIMSEFEIELKTKTGKIDGNLRDWAGVINACDLFVGCDSVGQHIAHSLGKNSIAIIGSTFPENISYKSKKFKVIDIGKDKRIYSPIRLCVDEVAEMNNTLCMKFDANTIPLILKAAGEFE